MPDPLAQIRASLPRGYEIDSPIDAGGQGAVFRGTINGQPAAIKLFDPSADPRRLERELAILHGNACSHLVRVLDSASIALNGMKISVVAYELHTGGDLRRHLAANAPALDANTLARIGHEVGVAVDALWAQRIVHRDIKPANIVQANDGRFVLVDVGLARQIDRSALTSLGVGYGTQGYMSPEQAQGRRSLTVHSDAFSLGITLYHLAARQHPFGGTQHTIGVAVPPPLGSVRVDLPGSLVRAIHDLIHVQSSLRPRAIAAHFVSSLGG